MLRNGVGLQETASVPLEGIKGLWALRSSFADSFDTWLVQSFASQTRVLAVRGDGLVEASLPGLDAGSASLCCRTLRGDLLLQATASSVRLLSSSGELITSWAPARGQRLTVAASCGDRVLVAAGRVLTLLDLRQRELVPAGSVTLTSEVACLELTGRGVDGAPEWAAVGLWDCSVRVVSVPQLAQVTQCVDLAPGERAVPRTLCFTTLGAQMRLSCGTSTGKVWVAAFDVSCGLVSNAQTLALGVLPVHLCTLPARGGSSALFASGDRPALLYASDSSTQILQNSVNLPAAKVLCTFNPRFCPGLVAIASPAGMRVILLLLQSQSHYPVLLLGLCVGRVDQVRKLHIETIPLHGERPRRIAYQETSATFGVCTVRVESEGYVCANSKDLDFDMLGDDVFNDQKESKSELERGEAHCFRLVDAVSMEMLNSVRLARAFEHCSAVATCILGESESAVCVASIL